MVFFSQGGGILADFANTNTKFNIQSTVHRDISL